MTAQQTAADDDVAREHHDLCKCQRCKAGWAEGQQTAAKERRRIRRALLALYVDARSAWLYRESVIAAIKKATRAPARKGRR